VCRLKKLALCIKKSRFFKAAFFLEREREFGIWNLEFGVWSLEFGIPTCEL
jgi:hypothetical protein